MIPVRHLWALSALALTLILGACSSPEDLISPTLEPQFGTSYNDTVVDVAVGPAGAVYELYNYVSPGFYDYDDYYYENGYEEVSVLTRYNASGGVVWEREVLREGCWDEDDCYTSNKTEAVFVDSNNYTYVLSTNRYGSEPDGGAPYVHYYVHKYAPQGEFITSFGLGYLDMDSGPSTLKLTSDASGNFYVAAADYSYGQFYVAKYTSTGSLVWKRASGSLPVYGVPTDITVSNGNTYVAGTKGYARYTSTGNLSWTKSGATTEIVAVGTNTIYTRNLTTIRKHDATGKQLWSKTQSGLSGMVVGEMTADGSANVYLTGKYSASSTNRNVFTRKLNSSGSVLWTKTFGTSAYDDARGIATLNGSEIYLTGLTQGSLAHSFRGGENDGYIRKLNSSGNPVWTR